MRILLSVLSLFIFFQQSYAQHIDSLHQKMIGTWELSKYLSTNNGTGNESPDKIKRVKTVTQSNYVLNLYEVKSGKLISKVSGNYSLSGTEFGKSNYQEKVVSAIPAIDSAQIKALQKLVAIDEADRMIYTWTTNFITYTEIWLRVVQKDSSAKGL
jgi:hypothetical protein